MLEPDARTILIEADVEDPVEPVLDGPMVLSALFGPLGRQGGIAREGYIVLVGGPVGGLGIALAADR